MNFFHTHISPRARTLVQEVLESGWVNEGPMTRRFETALAERLGLSRPVALNSGTAALHLALAVAGVGPGDEVVLPAQTFVATGLVVLMQGGKPVFADVDPLTGNLTAAALERALTPRTRVVIPVHWAGYPCDLDELHAVAGGAGSYRGGLAVVEDAAHALGATYRGRPIGAVSRFTAFSFQAIKHLTTGDGGALACLEGEDERQARARRWFGIDRDRSPASILGEREYDLDVVGYKSHMNDLAAAVGLGNLEDFAERLERRRAIAARYRRELAGLPGLRLPPLAPDRTHAYWLFPVLVEKREAFVRALAGRGVPASVVHRRIDRHRLFGGGRSDLPGQAAYDARQISLPVHEGLTERDVETVIAAVRGGW